MSLYHSGDFFGQLDPFRDSKHSLSAQTMLIFLWRSPKPTDRRNENNGSENIGIRRSFITHTNSILSLLIITIALGAYIKHQHYGLTCGWLGCHETFLPMNRGQWLQTLHRISALATTFYILWIACLAFFKSRSSGLRKRTALTAVTATAQMLVGAIAVITNLELSWAVIHLAIATALFGILIEIRVFLRFHC